MFAPPVTQTQRDTGGVDRDAPIPPRNGEGGPREARWAGLREAPPRPGSNERAERPTKIPPPRARAWHSTHRFAVPPPRSRQGCRVLLLANLQRWGLPRRRHDSEL